MELTEIKGSIFGYSKKSVCQYISELNVIQTAELGAEKAKAERAAIEYEDKIKSLDAIKSELESRNSALEEKIASLEAEVASLKEVCLKTEDDKNRVQAEYDVLLKETQQLRDKSDVISTAIINAEKCATTMINDADARAKEMIGEAEVKVADEVKRLETAKTYITEVRAAVEDTLKKIDRELGSIESDIADKAEDVYSDDKKTGVREKFEMLFKKA